MVDYPKCFEEPLRCSRLPVVEVVRSQPLGRRTAPAPRLRGRSLAARAGPVQPVRALTVRAVVAAREAIPQRVAQGA